MFKISRFRFYHQVEKSDCGITCLKMIARYYGRVIPLKYLRNVADISRSGISMRDLKACASAIGMKAIGIRVNLGMLDKIPLPAIAHWNGNHFVVLWKNKGDKFYIADPALGKVVLTREEFQERFFGGNEWGIMLVAAPTERFYEADFPKERRHSEIVRAVVGNVQSNKRSYIAILMLAILALAAEFCIPLLMKRSIDEGISSNNIPLVWIIVLIQAGILIGSQISTSLSSFVVNKLSQKLSFRAVDQYLTKLVSLPLSFFDSRVNADLIQKTFDREQVQQSLLGTPTDLLLILVNLLLFSAILLWFSPVVFGVFMCFTIVGLVWESFFLKRKRNLDYEVIACRSKNNNNIYELINGISDLKIHNAHTGRVDTWRKLQLLHNKIQHRINNLNLMRGSGASIIYQVRDISVTALCSTFVILGEISFGTMFTVAFVAGRVARGFNSVSSSMALLQQINVAIDRSNDVMEEQDEVRSGEIRTIRNGLSLKGVSFKYPGGENSAVIENLNLEIPLGKTIALVGRSGCGKTTLLKILQNLYCPVNGRYCADDVDVSTLSTEQWSRICTTVTQQGYIFSDTIAGNIALGEDEPDLARVEECVSIACLDDMVAKCPLGLKTIIGPAGKELSGGEKQRLLIARAIYRNTPILLLDEATSSLDAETERSIVTNLRNFGEGRTLVIAAHRLSTISHADIILMMQDGKIIEQGSHQELLDAGGRYADFVSGQLV